MKKLSAQYQALVETLPLIARAVGGDAIVADSSGHCLHAVGSDGQLRSHFDDSLRHLCRETAAQGRPMGVSDQETGKEAFSIPVGEYILAASNAERVERSKKTFATLKETLPLIAKVAGGDAVLFDNGGRRLWTATQKSPEPVVGPGTVSDKLLEVMADGKPHIGPSQTAPGATAVRMPITSEYGFGFNNADTTRRQEKLLEKIRRHQPANYTFDDIVHVGPGLLPALELSNRAAECQASVLILGESGTGKELFAQAIHNGSQRAHKPFIATNCAAIPENLAESTFFGYVDGSFTGARRGGQSGLFEQANGGTLLLDEISEMPLELQVKLLRVLQEKEVCRVGGNQPIPVDVRIIAASNRDLMQWVDNGQFRSDLFYRLNVIDIYLPPLRQRREDIPEISARMLKKLALSEVRSVPEMDPATLSALVNYDWPGNIRELHNVLERVISVSNGGALLPKHLPESVLKNADFGVSVAPKANLNGATRLNDQLSKTELQLVLDALERNGGSRKQAAKDLGISVTTLWRRIKKLQA